MRSTLAVMAGSAATSRPISPGPQVGSAIIELILRTTSGSVGRNQLAAEGLERVSLGHGAPIGHALCQS